MHQAQPLIPIYRQQSVVFTDKLSYTITPPPFPPWSSSQYWTPLPQTLDIKPPSSIGSNKTTTKNPHYIPGYRFLKRGTDLSMTQRKNRQLTHNLI